MHIRMLALFDLDTRWAQVAGIILRVLAIQGFCQGLSYQALAYAFRAAKKIRALKSPCLQIFLKPAYRLVVSYDIFEGHC